MPRSAARVMTLGSEVIMHPMPTVMTLRPVRPRVLSSSLTGEAGLADCGPDCGSSAMAEVAPRTGSARPAERPVERNSRRDVLELMDTPRQVENQQLE